MLLKFFGFALLYLFCIAVVLVVMAWGVINAYKLNFTAVFISIDALLDPESSTCLDPRRAPDGRDRFLLVRQHLAGYSR